MFKWAVIIWCRHHFYYLDGYYCSCYCAAVAKNFNTMLTAVGSTKFSVELGIQAMKSIRMAMVTNKIILAGNLQLD